MLLASLALACLPSVQEASATQTDRARVERLAGLCRLWGTAKLFHPWLAHEAIDWDRALVDALPAVEGARDAAEYGRALDGMLAVLGDPATHVIAATAATGEASAARANTEERVRRGASDAVAQIVVDDWDEVAANEQFFSRAFEECAKSAALILDLRRRGPLPPWDEDPAADQLAQRLRSSLGLLLDAPVDVGARRSLVRSGYPPCKGQSSGGYFTRFESTDGVRLEPREPHRAWKRMVILTNDGSRRVGALLDALQERGLATVLHQGSDARSLLDGDATVVELPFGVRARVRTSELVYSRGRVAFAPALCTPPSADKDGLLERATAIARGDEEPPEPPEVARGELDVPTREEAYVAMSAPAREYRLLALFRLWNVLRRFFPYQHLMERSLDELLPETIARFEAAEGTVAYYRAVLEFTANLRDSHVWVNGGQAAQLALSATHAPPIVLETLSTGPVVIGVLDEKLEESGSVQRGDVITAIDGRSVDERRAELAHWVAASTPQALAWNTDRVLLLGGPAGSSVRLKLRRGDEEREVELVRSRAAEELWQLRRPMHPQHPAFEVLDSGFGYFDLVQLEVAQVDQAFEAVRGTPGLILDLRGYPRGTAWSICARLADEAIVMAQFHRPFWHASNLAEPEEFAFDQPVEASGPWRYDAPIAVLIDHNAISQSEHSCLGFENAARGRITFVGSPTMGANGDVTNVVLPGNLFVSFSGHDVRHSDGRQLQRLGIQPDVAVEPTVAGWLAGRDEVLEAAVAAFSKTK